MILRVASNMNSSFNRRALAVNVLTKTSGFTTHVLVSTFIVMARHIVRKQGAPDVFIALLRGINVGGKNKLPMNSLAAIFADAGCEDVRTYIQSGNVVFRADNETASRIPLVVSKVIADLLGLHVPVITRESEALRTIKDSNPFIASGADPARLHVAFLADTPAKSRVDALDQKRSPPDEFFVQGSEIYLLLPNGVARTKLTNAYFDSKLETTSTIRNWKTVHKLLELAMAL